MFIHFYNKETQATFHIILVESFHHVYHCFAKVQFIDHYVFTIAFQIQASVKDNEYAIS